MLMPWKCCFCEFLYEASFVVEGLAKKVENNQIMKNIIKI